jgi:hypothetical protein
MRLFGPTQGDIWKILSNDIDAKFEIGNSLFKNYKVIKKFGDYTITLDTYNKITSTNRTPNPNPTTTATLTRIHSEFQNKYGFRFKIFGEYFNNYLPSFFDMKDAKIENLENLIIRSNNEFVIKTLLENSTIVDVLKTHPEILFQIHNSYGEKVTPNSFSTIYAEIPGVIKNNEILKNLFELMGESLLEIEKLNNNYEALNVNNFSHFDVIKNSVKNVIIDNFQYDKIKDNISNSIHKLIKPSNSLDSTKENSFDSSEITNEASHKKIEIKRPVECQHNDTDTYTDTVTDTDTDKNNVSINDSPNIQIENSTKTNTIDAKNTNVDLNNLSVDMSNLTIDTSNLTINTDNLKVDMSNLEKKLNNDFKKN